MKARTLTSLEESRFTALHHDHRRRNFCLFNSIYCQRDHAIKVAITRSFPVFDSFRLLDAVASINYKVWWTPSLSAEGTSVEAPQASSGWSIRFR